MGTKVRQARILMPLVLVAVIWGTPILASAHTVRAYICPIPSLADSIFASRHHCALYSSSHPPHFAGVTEGNEVSLLKALTMVHKNSRQYVAVLFYASWCPFSRILRPTYTILSYLYPSIPHFAIEESSIRPSILSKYGVHGFPTLILLNSTMRVRYHDNRTLGSLTTFYSTVTGINGVSLDKGSPDQIRCSSNDEKHYASELESCAFSWARSPKNYFKDETYLALATVFVFLRLLYFAYPTLLAFARFAWRRHIQNARLGGLLEHPEAFLNQVIQLFNALKEPCKKSNLQEGALSARAWASKSLATVSIGDASNTRGCPLSERC